VRMKNAAPLIAGREFLRRLSSQHRRLTSSLYGDI
jgi:hypothetical protein